MTWIALKMLVGDKAKFLGIVMGLMFAAMLITQQGSIFCGLMARTAGQVYDLKGADLWVMDANVRFIDDVKPMIENNLFRIRGVEGVKWAVPLYKGNGRVKLTSYKVDEHGRPGFEDASPTAADQPSKVAELKARISGLPLGWFADLEPKRHTYSSLTSNDGNDVVYTTPDEPGRRFRLPESALDLGQSIDLTLENETDPTDTRLVRRIRYDVIEQVILLGLDDSSMIGAPPPERIIAGTLEDLRRPDAILVDYNRLPKLFPGEPWHRKPKEPKWTFIKDKLDPGWKEQYQEECKQFYSRFIGRELEMNDHRAVIVGVCEASRTFQSNAVVYTTYSRAKQFVPRERKFLSYVLAAVEIPEPSQSQETSQATLGPSELFASLERLISGDPSQIAAEQMRKEVSARIQSTTGLKARTSQDFIWDTINYFLIYTGIPINFGITAFLGFVVGTAIAGQTFYLFTIDNLKQFGALKAMGATNLRIVRMILTQAVVVGSLGYGLGVGLAAFFGESNKGGELAFYTPWQLLPITAAAIVLICALASIVSVRKVIVLEPAVVFRG
jgi:putative ABC transport system permease protein